MLAPSPNGANGRDSGGRFTRGNPGGPGNPHARRSAELRAAMLATVTDEDIRVVVRALIDKARGGDLGAIREVLDRTIGKAGAEPAHAADRPTVVAVVPDGCG